MSEVSLSQLASDLSRVHRLLSFADGDPDEYEFSDPCFEAALRRRLKSDPAQARQLRQIASEVAMLVSD